MTATDRPAPRATYRLQLTKDFTFGDAAALAPYLGRLGISHAYLSPVLKARKGSTHGYDTVDHTLLNPELGTRADFDSMAAALRAHGIGIVLDIVPNHMGIGGDENPYWLDVLEWGPRSRYADWFDINWSPTEPRLRDKLLVPFLGCSFGEAIEQGKLELRADAASQSFAVWAEGAHKLPVCPSTYPLILDLPGDVQATIAHFNSPAGRDDLVRLIDAQHWRPAHYLAAADDINYRRFFTVSDLAGLRVERDDVFEQVHRLTFELVAAGLVDGLRVDHIDGLYDPKAYLARLRQRCPKPIWLVVEKILAPHELLRADWDVDGTTGYEFGTVTTQLLADSTGEADLTAAYQRFTGETTSFDDIERDAKLGIVDLEMGAELDSLTARLHALSAGNPRTADLTRNALRHALRAIVAAMPVYRTYVDAGPLDQRDRRTIGFAVAHARQTTAGLDPEAFSFVAEAMGGTLADTADFPADAVLDIARRIQQYTGPVMAKGLEDTALYRFNRLIALSDVGEKPDRFGRAVAAFHDYNVARQRTAPLGLLTSSSHDTKRGEDVRAQIATLPSHAGAWAAAVATWYDMLERAGAPQIDRNDSYFFFQMLLGAWPVSFAPNGPVDAAELAAFKDRLNKAMLKSIREARRHTNWAVPEADYEKSVGDFISVAFGDAEFLSAFRSFAQAVAVCGMQNGLIQTTLKLTVPGVPDIYQGAELWEQSLVDPDNRRPVDFAARDALLAGGARRSYPQLLVGWRDGRIKQRLIADLLALRKADPELFARGSYEPVAAPAGVCAFLRRYQDRALLVAVQFLPWPQTCWGDAELTLPGDVVGRSWTPVLGEAVQRTAPRMSALVAELPVAAWRLAELG